MEIRPTLHNEALSHPWQPPGQPSPGGAEAYKTPRIDVSGNSGKWLLLDRWRTVYCMALNSDDQYLALGNKPLSEQVKAWYTDEYMYYMTMMIWY